MASSLTPAAYLASLPDDRRKALARLRALARRTLPEGFTEVAQYGISYVVPLKVSGPTYNGQPLPVLTLAAQKNHLAAYLIGLYSRPALRAEFERRWKATGLRLDMGKSCLRFRSLEELDLDVLGWALGQVTPQMLVGARADIHEERSATAKKRARSAPSRSRG